MSKVKPRSFPREHLWRGSAEDLNSPGCRNRQLLTIGAENELWPTQSGRRDGFEGQDLLTGCNIPELDSPISICGGCPFAVRAEGEILHCAYTKRRLNLRAGPRIPGRDSALDQASQQLAVTGEHQGAYARLRTEFDGRPVVHDF